MTRRISFAIAIAAALASASAFADDITVDNTPFVSTKSRAEVRADLMNQKQRAKVAADEWSVRRDQQRQARREATNRQSRAEYAADRDEVKALNGEDSGSAYLSRQAARRRADTATMGAPAR